MYLLFVMKYYPDIWADNESQLFKPHMALVGKSVLKNQVHIYTKILSIRPPRPVNYILVLTLLPYSSKHEWKEFNTILLFCCHMEVRNRQVSRRAEFRKYLGCHEGGELSIICRHPMRAECFVAILKPFHVL